MIRAFSLIFLIMLSCGLLTVTAQPSKVIIDCDPGVDDAMALILALKYPGFDILGELQQFLEMPMWIKLQKTL